MRRRSNRSNLRKFLVELCLNHGNSDLIYMSQNVNIRRRFGMAQSVKGFGIWAVIKREPVFSHGVLAYYLLGVGIRISCNTTSAFQMTSSASSQATDLRLDISLRRSPLRRYVFNRFKHSRIFYSFTKEKFT